jgi:hypothetical protein
MATPIVELIAVELVALINGVTIAAGFNQDLTAVRPKRLHLEGDLNNDNTVIVEQEDAAVEAASEDETMLRQGFTLQALVIDSDTATAPLDQRLNKVAADIIKKLFWAANWTLGGYADGIVLRGTEKFIADPQVAGIAINIDVLFRIVSDDPYSQP